MIKGALVNSLKILLLISLSGCAGNNVCFNIEKQSIKSCSRNGIVSFDIMTDSQTYEFHVKKGVKTQDEIILNEILKSNAIVDSYPDQNDRNFILRPGTEYTFINRTVKDATASKIIFSTDTSTKVVIASKVNCN